MSLSCPLCPRSGRQSGHAGWSRACQEQSLMRSLDPSLRFDASRLDDRPPFLDLGLVESSQSLWRMLVVWHNLVAQLCKPPARHGVGQSRDDRRVELADHFPRRALRSPNRTPDRSVEPGQSSLVCSRDIRYYGRAAPAGDRIAFYRTGAHLRGRRCLVSDNQVDMTGHQILRCWCAAAIMHEVEAGAGRILEQNAEDVLRATYAGRPRQGLFGVCLQPDNEIF